MQWNLYTAIDLCSLAKEWLHKGFLWPQSSLWQDDFCSARHEKQSGTVKWANQQWCGEKEVSVYTNKCKKKKHNTKRRYRWRPQRPHFKETIHPYYAMIGRPNIAVYTRQQQVNNKRSNNATPCGIRFNHTLKANTVSHNSRKPALVKLGAYIYLIKKSAI